jgi:hypothetical protein
MRPRADEVMQSITWTFEKHIVPDLTDPLARSLCLTMSYLLRQVELRIRLEGPALHADIREARKTLASVQTLLAQAPAASSEPALSGLANEIAEALGRVYRSPDEYPVVESLLGEAEAMNWALVHAIKVLDATGERFPQHLYGQVRDEIRAYMAHQLERQARYVCLPTGEQYNYAGLDPLAGRL